MSFLKNVLPRSNLVAGVLLQNVNLTAFQLHLFISCIYSGISLKCFEQRQTNFAFGATATADHYFPIFASNNL